MESPIDITSGTNTVNVDQTESDFDYADYENETSNEESDCDYMDPRNLIDIHVVGAPDSGEFALGSNLTVECTLNTSSPCASELGFTLGGSTRLVLMRQQVKVAEGRASSPPRFNFVAHGVDNEFLREDSFVCRAFDESGTPIPSDGDEGNGVENDATFNYCSAQPRLPQADCEVSLTSGSPHLLRRPLLKCSITPDDLTLGRESHCTFESNISLIERPISSSTVSRQHRCDTRDRADGHCEWDFYRLGLKRLYLHVDGRNAIVNVSSTRLLNLNQMIRLQEALAPPRIRVMEQSAMDAVLRVDWSAPTIDSFLTTIALLNEEPLPYFEFSLRLRCNRSLFPLLQSCSVRFNERIINVSNVSSVSFEQVPAGAVYELEIIARVPPNTRSSPPRIVFFEVQVLALQWMVFIFVCFALLVFTIAIVACLLYYIRQRMLRAGIRKMIPDWENPSRECSSPMLNITYYPEQEQFPQSPDGALPSPQEFTCSFDIVHQVALGPPPASANASSFDQRQETMQIEPLIPGRDAATSDDMLYHSDSVQLPQ